MYCTNCGKEIDDNLKFCNYCGTPTQPTEKKPEPQAPKKPVYEQPVYSAPEPKPKKSKAPIVIGVIAAVLIVFYLIGHFANAKYKKEAMQYLTESSYDKSVKESVEEVAEEPVEEPTEESAEKAAQEMNPYYVGEDDSEYRRIWDFDKDDGIHSTLDDYCASAKYGGYYADNTLRYGPLALSEDGQPTIQGDYLVPYDKNCVTSVFTADWEINWDTVDPETMVKIFSDDVGDEVTGYYFEKDLNVTDEMELPTIIFGCVYTDPETGEENYVATLLGLHGRQADFVHVIVSFTDSKEKATTELERFIKFGAPNNILVTYEDTHIEDTDHITDGSAN